MPAEHRAEAIEQMRARALSLLEPLREDLGDRMSDVIERDLMATIEEIEQSA